MKQFLFAAFVVCFFTGCEQFMSSDKLIRQPNLQFSSLSDIREYVVKNIHYKSDDGDYWQAPQETIDKGTGDCEDYCLFVGYFAQKLGYRVYLVAISYPEGCHMILELNGAYYEAQSVRPYVPRNNMAKIARYSLENALRMSAIIYGSRYID